MEHVEKLRAKAIELQLAGAADISSVAVADLAAVYNGCGPDWLHSDIRGKLTGYLGIFEPAFLIHDCRFAHHADMTFTGANLELEENLYKIARATYAWYNWRRYRAIAAAELITEACNRFGWTAWSAGC